MRVVPDVISVRLKVWLTERLMISRVAYGRRPLFSRMRSRMTTRRYRMTLMRVWWPSCARRQRIS